MRTILIVGGGAAGICAALASAQARPGSRVLLLEKLDRVGKKILVTGSGRCNLGNRNIAPARYHSSDPAALAALLQNLPAEMTPAFFTSLGLYSREEEGGRLYPNSGQAGSVLEVLLLALRRCGVEVRCGCRVSGLRFAKGRFALTTEGGEVLAADRVILANGGRATRKLGCEGDGYALAQGFGHRCLPVYPCLTALRCEGAELPGLKGTRVQGAARLFAGGTLLGASCGELQLADYGVSGIPAMELSCLLHPGTAGPITLEIDLLPKWTLPRLRTELAQRAAAYPEEPLENYLAGLLHKKAGYALLKRCGLAPLSRPAGSLRPAEQAALAQAIKGWRFPVTGVQPWEQAQCTGGGIPLDEVDPLTLESRRQPGLYLAGELLDAVGDCGGFNLHWAWCTGLAAGRAAAQ